jgi:hypothetical protein
MPLGFHVIPNIGRIATEYAMSGFKNPEERLITLAGIIVDAFNPIGGGGLSLQTITPTAFDPLAALAENKDWTGKPIYREDFNSMKPTPGFTRNKDTASVWSKYLAEFVNWSTGGTEYTPGKLSPTADQFDYLFGQVTGGVGREISKVSQLAQATITGEDIPTYKRPLTSRFYGDEGGQANQGNRYYTNIKALNALDAEIKGRRSDGLPLDEFKRDNPDWKLIERAKYAERVINKLKREKKALIERGAPRDRVQAMDERITKEMTRLNDAIAKSQ